VISPGHVADEKKVVVNASAFDERSLTFGDDIPHGGRKPHRKQHGRVLYITKSQYNKRLQI
jgi:hypothetical protein